MGSRVAEEKGEEEGEGGKGRGRGEGERGERGEEGESCTLLCSSGQLAVVWLRRKVKREKGRRRGRGG